MHLHQILPLGLDSFLAGIVHFCSWSLATLWDSWRFGYCSSWMPTLEVQPELFGALSNRVPSDLIVR